MSNLYTTHELMVKTNHYLIKGGELTDSQKSNIVNQFLSAQNDERTKQSFYKSVKYPNNVDKNGSGHMYPIYFIPPYNCNKKYQTVIPVSPKTHILSANSYELEIIRLLHLFAPKDAIVEEMVIKSLERLKTTCFGYHDCVVGECYHSTFIVLRFLATVAPNEVVWINKLINKINENLEEKLKGNNRVHGNLKWYFWLCLSELPFDIAEPNILKYKNEILTQLNRSYVMNSENDKTIHPVLICIIRNVMARLPQYVYIKNRQPYINEKDGRLYLDMQIFSDENKS